MSRSPSNFSGGYTKLDLPITPMIDVVFQLLTFFILTLKIVEPEGSFQINMPASGSGPGTAVASTSAIKVRLRANPDGTLADLSFGEISLGNTSPACFQRLNQQVGTLVGGGQGFNDDREAEIDADYELNYQYVIKAVSACMGSIKAGVPVRYIEKIKFAPPHHAGDGQ